MTHHSDLEVQEGHPQDVSSKVNRSTLAERPREGQLHRIHFFARIWLATVLPHLAGHRVSRKPDVITPCHGSIVFAAQREEWSDPHRGAGSGSGNQCRRRSLNRAQRPRILQSNCPLSRLCLVPSPSIDRADRSSPQQTTRYSQVRSRLIAVRESVDQSGACG